MSGNMEIYGVLDLSVLEQASILDLLKMTKAVINGNASTNYDALAATLKALGGKISPVHYVLLVAVAHKSNRVVDMQRDFPHAERLAEYFIQATQQIHAEMWAFLRQHDTSR